MLLLALYPILSMYGSLLDYGIWAFLLLIMYIWVSSSGKVQKYLPEFYLYYWIYLGVDYLFLTQKLGAIVPGGVSFFVFSIILMFISKQFDLSYYKKYMRILVLVSVVLFFAQEFMWLTTGSRFVPVAPLGDLTTTLTYSELISRNMAAERSASIFLEPAHFALFLHIGLIVELFSNNKGKFISGYSILIIAALLLLRSGTGLVGLGVVLISKASTYLKQLTPLKRIALSIIMVGTVTAAIYLYVRTEAGTEMYERSGSELTLNEEGHSYARFVVGTLIYSDLPLMNKIIGASDDTLFPIAKKYAFYADDDANILYMNGWAYVLAHTGLIGFIFLLLILVKLYRGNTGVAKCGIWLFVVCSFFSQTYGQPLMLIVLIIASYYQSQSKIKIIDEKEKNIVLHSCPLAVD